MFPLRMKYRRQASQLNAFFYSRDHLEMNRSQSWTDVNGLAISGPRKILTSKEHGIHTDRYLDPLAYGTGLSWARLPINGFSFRRFSAWHFFYMY